MKKIKLSLVVILIGISAVFAQQLIDGIVAIIGKEIILKSEIDQHVQNYVVQNRIDPSTNQEVIANLRNQTLEKLIEQKILLTKAAMDTIEVEDELIDRQVEQRIRYLIDRVGSESKLEAVFGGNMKKIRKDTYKIIKEQMVVEKTRTTKFRGMKISRREVEKFYKTYKDSLPEMQESVEVGHILKNIKPSESALSAAYQKTEKLFKRIKAGESFEELAKIYSEDPASAKRGGDLGLISRGDFVPEFEATAFSLKDGELSEIVQTQFGFHIIKMIERRGEKVRTRHILIQSAPNEDDEKRVVQELDSLRNLIVSGADFKETALENSDDDNVKKDEGMLGFFETEKMVIPQFKTIVAELSVGAISEPFKTDYGYHIVYLKDRQAARPLTLKDDWQRIEQIALNMRMETEYKNWIRELKKSIAIELKAPSNE
jgi:peptidyl-prolyl cis-trans isomerase SurA